MLKYLRIAVTALSLTACVLLIALWVRSYWVWDVIDNGVVPANSGISSVYDDIGISIATDPAQRTGLSGFRWVSAPVGKYLRRHDWLPRIEWNKYRRGVVVRYWMLVSFCIALASVPWLPRRFSLRTLLIATTLVAVALGTVVLS